MTDPNGNGTLRFDCDLLVASAGLSPQIGPLSTAGAKLAFDEHTCFFLPEKMPPRVHAAGRLLGLTDPAAIEASGRVAGLKAVCNAGLEISLTQAENELTALPGPAKGNSAVHAPGIGEGRKAFICLDEDGTLKTARQSAQQGFDLPELAKRFGGFGLGPGQGAVPGHNLPLVLASFRKGAQPELIPTTIRSPLSPVLMATMAGSGHSMLKHTPMHRQQERLGAIFERTGAWMRASRFSEDASCTQEIKAVRSKVGMIDISTLGKFRLFGPDALKALQRVYISNMSEMNTGRLRYSAMLNDDGMLLDDGVVARIAENDYYFTTSSARAAQTEEWFRYHTRFENWEYHLVNLTDHLAAVNLAGPRSRQVLGMLIHADLSNDAFPYMAYHEFSLNGSVPVRALRLGFLGELSYELHFPASYGPSVWNRLMADGAELGIKPIGLEAQNVCRMEKGHVIIGVETEQRVNLLDLGLGFLWDKDDVASCKVGAPALKFTRNQRGRMKLIGLQIDDGRNCPGDGAVLYQDQTIAGYICTARNSITLGRSIATALVEDCLASIGSRVHIYQNEGKGEQRFTATVVKMPFYDPHGQKLKS
jgi:sarcosine oxidase subunit alpha